MDTQRLGGILGGFIACAALAGCAPFGQVPASEPHAQVHVRIDHGDPKDDENFVDQLHLDGLRYDLTSGKPMLLRLAPGKHELQLISQRTETRVQLVPYEEYDLQCRTPNCNDVATRVPVRSERLELISAPQTGCAQTFVIDVQAGQSIQTTLLASADGTCTAGS